MTYDDYIAACREHDDDPAVADLVRLLEAWKDDATDVLALCERVERHFGQRWIESDAVHERLYGLWDGFRQSMVGGIGGQTMNERLYWFGLMERFDACGCEGARATLYAKLLASP